MTQPLLPLLVEPEELEMRLGDKNLRVVDLSRAEHYQQGHVPAAVHLEYARLLAPHPPAMGLAPAAAQLSEVLGGLGLTPATHVVAYDDEGNGKPARFLRTLDLAGHPRYSLLNGGRMAWLKEHRPLDRAPVPAAAGHYPVTPNGAVTADKTYILSRLGDPGVALLDARSPGEYRGEVRRAARAGHIPGAVNFEWVNAMDPGRELRLRSSEELLRALAGLGVTPDKEVIVYCHTHHRSAHTYFVLRHLGFARVKGYPGSWSEWGNNPDTPIE